MVFRAKVRVNLKKSVLDPQGKAVLHALETLGFSEARDVRVGKYFEIAVDGKDAETAKSRIQAMCDKLLINPVIEDYSFDLEPC